MLNLRSRAGAAGALALLALAALAGCVPGQSGTTRLAVVSTVTQVSSIVRAVGGTDIELTALEGPGDDPHQYEVRPSQVPAIARARVIFTSGAGLDKWMDRAADAAGKKASLVDLSGAVTLRSSATEGVDPHWWYDIDNAARAGLQVAAELGRQDPPRAQRYAANATAFRQRLAAADAGGHTLMDPIPVKRRLLVANHDAFGYLLGRYGITLVGDIVPSTDSMSAIRSGELSRLVSQVAARHVCAIFTETTIDPKLAQQVAGEAHVKVYAGRLYGDALGAPGTPGATLEGAIAENLRLMAAGFTSC